MTFHGRKENPAKEVAVMAAREQDLPPVLTVREAAKVLGVGKNKMYDLTRRKGFPAIRDGWRILIPRDALFRWLEEEAFRNTGEAAATRTRW